MSRERRDRRKNMRHQFALYHADGSRVGAYWLSEADGCERGYDEFGSCYEVVQAETHEPGSHVLDAVAVAMAHTHPHPDMASMQRATFRSLAAVQETQQ